MPKSFIVVCPTPKVPGTPPHPEGILQRSPLGPSPKGCPSQGISQGVPLDLWIGIGAVWTFGLAWEKLETQPSTRCTYIWAELLNTQHSTLKTQN